jgi:hypothetical protein
MSMTVHNLMGFNHHFFRPQPVIQPKQERAADQTQSFQDVLNEKMKANSGLKK